MTNLSNKIGDMTLDGLVSDIKPAPQVRKGVIAHGDAEVSFVRGTIMEKSADGKLHILGTNPVAEVTEDFNGDASATTFTLTATAKPLAIKSVKVGTTAVTIASYNAQTGVVTLSAAPAAGTKNVHVTYDRADANTPDCVLCDDVTVGTSNDETVAVYTAGCFNTSKVTVKTNYTITDADLDALRCRNIVFKAASKSV